MACDKGGESGLEALYCFCFASTTLPLDLDFAHCGWDDPVQVRRVGGFHVVLSRVALACFSGPAAEERLADPAWLIPRARAHDQVIAHAMGFTTPYPLSFGTLYSSTQALGLTLAECRGLLREFFERMAGHTEWAVKVQLDRERALAALVQDQAAPAVGGGAGGRAYLLRQRRKAAAEQSLGPWLAEQLVRLDAELEPLVQTISIQPARAPAVASRACLVGAGRVESFHAAIAVIGAEMSSVGLALSCSGPWPLYSFRVGL